jgi:hypothetical protein
MKGGYKMVKYYYHRWTEDEERILLNIMMSEERKKKKDKFIDASEKLDRTLQACENRYHILKSNNKK